MTSGNREYASFIRSSMVAVAPPTRTAAVASSSSPSTTDLVSITTSLPSLPHGSMSSMTSMYVYFPSSEINGEVYLRYSWSSVGSWLGSCAPWAIIAAWNGMAVPLSHATPIIVFGSSPSSVCIALASSCWSWKNSCVSTPFSDSITMVIGESMPGANESSSMAKPS